ncbi:hypothetical protein DMUE_1176 [Dictyocoela muelleri]|nr:hypothetical protein DMUE_1176 [Dictyocoela muelleri]
MHLILKTPFIISLLTYTQKIICALRLNENNEKYLITNNHDYINNLELIENPKLKLSHGIENILSDRKCSKLIKIASCSSNEIQALIIGNFASRDTNMIIDSIISNNKDKLSFNHEFTSNPGVSSSSKFFIESENFSKLESNFIRRKNVTKKRSLESENDNQEKLQNKILKEKNNLKKFKNGNILTSNLITSTDKNSEGRCRIMKIDQNSNDLKININDLLNPKNKCIKPILCFIDEKICLFFKKTFNTNLHISVINNPFNFIRNDIFDIKILKKELFDPFRGTINNNESLFLISESIENFKIKNQIQSIIDATTHFSEIIQYEADIHIMDPNFKDENLNLEDQNTNFKEKNPNLEDPCFFEKRKIITIIKNIHSLSKNSKYKKFFTENGNNINFYIMMAIETFFEVIIKDNFINLAFPEINIIYKLYKANLNHHTLKDRKTHSGYFIVKQIFFKIYELKDYFYNKKVEHDPKIFSEKILKIRVLYLLDLFKFINIKKVYLLLYLIECINVYHLNNCKKYNTFAERVNFYNIFNNSTAENLKTMKYNLEMYRIE